MIRPSFQTKVFFSAIAAATLALAVAGSLFAIGNQRQADARIERTLVAEARLVADLIERELPAASASTDLAAQFDAEADRVGSQLNARFTLIAADGRVLGDSAEPLDALATLENHRSRPEVVAAAASGIGIARRYSDTVRFDMLYVALPIAHPAVAFVRVALPLSNLRQQLAAILTPTLTTLGVALLGAIVISLVVSGRLGKRVRTIADIARRYRQGDLTPPHVDYGDDELGDVARALDESVQELGARLGELARDRGRMAAILTGMIEGVIVVDPQGRLQLVNGAAQEMLRLDETPIGRHYIESIRHPAIANLLTAALAGGAPDLVELAPPRDPSRTIMARAAPAAAGQAHGIVLVLHDVTELKKADRIRRDFVANVSHELRTPLTAIRGYVEALAEGDVNSDESQQFLDIILRHTLRMERLVKDLLRLARLDAGQEVLEMAVCDVRGLIQGVVADLTSALDGRNQRVEVEVGPDAQRVRADPSKAHDVLRNLVTNASTYSPIGSTIQIQARRDGDFIAIDILDEGPGIPEDDLARVFERFYRVDKSRARDPGGTGLGLAIVKHLVGLHGGEATAANRASGGSRFTITFRAG